MKKFIKITLYWWRYDPFSVRMADFASYHYNWRRLAPNWSIELSITYMIVDIIIYIYMQKSMSNSRYSWSYGSAKFDAATASIQAKLCRAIALSILHFFRYFLQIQKDNVVLNQRASRHADMTSAWFPLSLHTTKVLAWRRCHGWRRMCGVRYIVPTSKRWFWQVRSGHLISRWLNFYHETPN